MAQPVRVNPFSCRLADYQYIRGKAVATYAQSTGEVQKHAAELRKATPGRYERYDLDRGFQFAEIPMILWLQIQQLGIESDTPAIIRFLQRHKDLTGEDYFTTTKNLL